MGSTPTDVSLKTISALTEQWAPRTTPRLDVAIVKAANFWDHDVVGLGDPYVVVEMGGSKYKTRSRAKVVLHGPPWVYMSLWDVQEYSNTERFQGSL